MGNSLSGLYRAPAYIPEYVLNNKMLIYRWDDWKASEAFRYDPKSFLARAYALNVQSRIALTLGLYEWIIWRLNFALADPIPFQIVEAAWCASIDPIYMIYTEFKRRDWMGPVRGPIWCAMTWLIPAVMQSDEKPEELESGLSYLVCLAHHVMNDPATLEHWISQTLNRLHKYYPATPDDPFTDLFGEHRKERNGDPLPLEILDPAFPYNPDSNHQLIANFLGTINFSANPFLRKPSHLAIEENGDLPSGS